MRKLMMMKNSIVKKIKLKKFEENDENFFMYFKMNMIKFVVL